MYGYCSVCGEWVKLGPDLDKNWLPNHRAKDGYLCKNSKYGATDYKFEVDNPEAAKELAKKMLEDDGRSLRDGDIYSIKRVYYGICSTKLRLLLSQALIRFFVEKNQLSIDIDKK